MGGAHDHVRGLSSTFAKLKTKPETTKYQAKKNGFSAALNPFLGNGSHLLTLKTPENLCSSGFFKGVQNGNNTDQKWVKQTLIITQNGNIKF